MQVGGCAAAAAGAGGVTSLDHEGGDYAVDWAGGEVALAGEGEEILGCVGSVLGVELEGYGAHCGLEDHIGCHFDR